VAAVMIVLTDTLEIVMASIFGVAATLLFFWAVVGAD